ncbi:MAG: PAS domain S-box protein [Syntrophobacteraceae bacterium]
MKTGDQENASYQDEFRVVFEKSQIGIMFLKDYRILYRCNQRLADILGYDCPEEMAGLSMRALHLSQEHYLDYGEKYYNPLTRGVQIQVEYQLRRKDGTPVWCSLSGNATDLNNPPDLNKGVIWCVDDISRRKAAEEEILAQRETLAKMFESMPYLAMLVNREGRVTKINHKGATFAGRPQEEILGLLPGEVFACWNSFANKGCGKSSNCGGCRVSGTIAQTFATGREVHDVEARMLVRRGSKDVPCDILISTALLRDDDSEKVLVTIDDITDRKLAQRDLHESRERLSQIIDFLPGPTFAIDLEGRVIIWNKAQEKLSGIKAEDIIGKGNYEYSLPFYGYRRPILTDAAIGHDDAILNLYSCVHKDGDILLAETDAPIRDGKIHVLSCKASPLYDSTGNIIGAIESVRDVTEIRKTQEMLKQSEQLYRSVVENMRDVFYRTDRKGFITMVSPSASELYGAPCEEIIGMHVNSFLMDLSERKKMLGKLLKEGMVRDYELLLQKKDGSPLYASFTSICVKDRQGNALGIEGVVRDITDRKRTEEAARLAVEELRTSEKRLRRAELVARIGNFELTLASNGVYASEGARIIYGMEKAPGSITEVQRIPLPEYRPMLDKALRELIEEGKAYNVEFKIRRPCDGKIADIHTVAEYSAPQRLVYGIIQDITERKRIEASLRESEELFRNIFDDHSAVKLIIDPDTGNIQNANKAAAAYYGWPKEKLLRMNIEDLIAFPGQKQDQCECRQAMHCEGRHFLADGSVRDVEVFKSRIVVREKVLYHFIIHDITERKEAERLLRESEEKYHRLFDNINDAVFVHLGATDAIPGIFIEVNEVACKRLGYTREELLQMSPVDIDAPETLPAVPHRMEKLYQNGHWTWEGVHIAKDGQRIPVEISNRLFDFRGMKGILSTARDISVAKKAQEEKEMLQSQLNQAQKLESVGRLAGGVAHDFNNMLGVILGHAELAMGQIDQTHELFADLSEIRKAANRSADLTRQLLAFARRQTISPRVLNLNTTVEGMSRMLRRLIGEDIDLVWVPATNLWPVKVDPGQIDQILANLCVNARDAISGTGKVTIETGTVTFDNDYCANHPDFLPGEFVMLAVSDNGCGMVKEIREKIFEPFYTTKGMGEGTGLGLATVYGIVKQNHGFINVYSEPGKGTTFKIYLPRAQEQATKEPAAPSEKNLRGRETVLVVEDEAPILALVKNVLERYGYQVLAAKSPTEALQRVPDHPGPIHLIITDVVMPEMNGKDLRDKLARLIPEVRIIFMSGYTANVIAHHGILDKDIDFLQKPFSIKTLLQRVRSVLDR